MNWLDIVLLVILALSLVAGLLKGLIREVFSLGGVILGIFAAIALAPVIAPTLDRFIHFQSASYASALLVVFLLINVVVEIVARIINKMVKFAQLGIVNHVLGGAFGLLRGVLIGVILVLGITLFLEPGHPLLTTSRVTPILGAGARALSGLLPEDIRMNLREKLDRIDEARRGDATI